MKLVYLNIALILFQLFELIGARWDWTGNGFKFLIPGSAPVNNWALQKVTQTNSPAYFPNQIQTSQPVPNALWPNILHPTYHIPAPVTQSPVPSIPVANVTTEAPILKSSCVIPPMGSDGPKFDLRCTLPSNKEEVCKALEELPPSGTTMTLKCKPPFISESSGPQLGIWTCDDGVWKGEFKDIRCIEPPSEEKPKQQQASQTPTEFQPLSAQAPSWFLKYSKLKEIHNLTKSSEVDTNDTLIISDNSGWSSTTPKPIKTTEGTMPLKISDSSTSNYMNWNANQERKCPALSKRIGVRLKCVSKIPYPKSPSSYVVTEDECETRQHIGSEATYQCEKYYEATSALKTLYRKCKADGTWSGGADIFSCALECGVSNPVGHVPLITHGEPTFKAQWPWHAAIFSRSSSYANDPNYQNWNYICGGTLINKKVILTAAHCLTNSAVVRDASLFKVDLGRHERAVDDEYVQTFYVEEIIIHPDYNPNSYDSDIAVLILRDSVAVGYHVRPICYPQQQNTAFEDVHLSSGSIGTVVGFGLNENNVEAETLRMAKLKVISSKECALSFSDTLFGSNLAKSTTFCAGLKNGTNVCSGDSGGGIYFPASTVTGSRWYLRGLVSVGVQTHEGGSKRCDPTRYSIFTKISPYADWIGRILSTHDYHSYY